ncbi:MAG TPA: hypothetical protein VF848_04815 [Steroidobacteraceae bacterium]
MINPPIVSRCSLLLLPLLAASSLATAQQSPDSPGPSWSPITDRFALSAIYSNGRISTDGHLDPSPALAGTEVSMEHDLGLTPNAHQGRAEVMFHFAYRWRVRVDFLDLSRQATVSLARPVTFGADQFNVGDMVSTKFNWQQMNITPTYALIQNERFEFGLGLSIHLFEMEMLGQVPSRGLSQDFTGAGPYPSAAADGVWQISRRWAVTARANYLNLTVNGYTGVYQDWHGDVQFRAQANFSIGAGYESTAFDFSDIKSTPTGAAQMHIRGPELRLRASF